MAAKIKENEEAQNPLILRCNRLMEAFAKSDDERDFYLDKKEGFLVYVDLDKSVDELNALDKELLTHVERYLMIPKLSYYETKKIMESFVNEKVYDIDTKEKLLDIIQSREARENFLEYVYDQHVEFEKWQQFYQERSRVRIIEWLRQNHFHFVFEEDLDLPKSLIEKLKCHLFDLKVGKDVLSARKTLMAKAKSYYSSEALNPRPKRGRPPKQAVKLEIEPQVSTDIFLTVLPAILPFLYIPEISSPSAIAFSSKFDGEEDFLARRRSSAPREREATLEEFNQKLAALRNLSSGFDDEKDEEDEDFDGFDVSFDEEKPSKKKAAKPAVKKVVKKAAAKAPAKKAASPVKKAASSVKKAAASEKAKAPKAIKKASALKAKETKPKSKKKTVHAKRGK